MQSDREVFEDLIQTIERHARDNEATISNVELWAKHWREELYRERVYSNDCMEIEVLSKPPNEMSILWGLFKWTYR